MKYFSALDWIVLGVYFLVTLCIGLYFWRKSRTTENFTAAGRSFPGWLIGLSIFASYLSSISYLALPGKSFSHNWNALVFSFAVPFATWIAVVRFLPYYRAKKDVSAYSNLENRFGLWARLYASIFYLLLQLSRNAVITYLLALPMSVIFGWDIRLIIVLTGLTVTTYTFIGGIMAVIWTDAVQTVVLLAGAFVAIAVLAFKVDGGLIGAMTGAFHEGKLSLGAPGVALSPEGVCSFDFGSSTILVILLYAITVNLKAFGIDQSYVQRYQTAKSEKEARKSLWLGAIMYLPASLLFFLIGTLLFMFYHSDGRGNEDLREVYQIVARQKLRQEGVRASYTTMEQKRVFSSDYQHAVDEKAATLREKDIGDAVFPHFIGKHLPPGLTGLLIAAIFSAGMSTISGGLNSQATLILKDYYLRFFRPGASEKESMRVLYAGTILWGILATALGLALVKLTDSALDLWWTFAGIFGGGMLGLFLIGILVKRARNFSAVVGVVAGTLMIFWLTIPDIVHWLERHGANAAAAWLLSLAERFGGVSPYHHYMIPVFGTLTMVLVGYLASFFEPKNPTVSTRVSGETTNN